MRLPVPTSTVVALDHVTQQNRYVQTSAADALCSIPMATVLASPELYQVHSRTTPTRQSAVGSKAWPWRSFPRQIGSRLTEFPVHERRQVVQGPLVALRPPPASSSASEEHLS